MMSDQLFKSVLLALLILIVSGLNALASEAGSNSSIAQWNGTTYHLEEDHLEVTIPINASGVNLTLDSEALNMTLFDESGRNISFNSVYRFRRGDHLYGLTFNESVRGRLVYLISRQGQGQQFILPVRDPGPIRILLPRGYTTGERSLGIARPQPEQISDDPSGVALTWNNTTGMSYIEVTYYRKSAPRAMMMIFAILFLAGLVILAQYYLSKRRLEAARKEIEERRN